MTPGLPLNDFRWRRFASSDRLNGSTGRIRLTQHPNGMPTFDRCAGAPVAG